MKTILNVYRKVGDTNTCYILYADGTERKHVTATDVSEVYARNKGIAESVSTGGQYSFTVEGVFSVKVEMKGGVSGVADYNATNYNWLHIDTGEHRMIVPKTVTVILIEDGDDDEARALAQEALRRANERAAELQIQCDVFNEEYAHAIASYAKWCKEEEEKKQKEEKQKAEKERQRGVQKRLNNINEMIYKFFSLGQWDRERNENGQGWRDNELATSGRFAKDLNEVKPDGFASWEQFCDYAELRYSKSK